MRMPIARAERQQSAGGLGAQVALHREQIVPVRAVQPGESPFGCEGRGRFARGDNGIFTGCRHQDGRGIGTDAGQPDQASGQWFLRQSFGNVTPARIIAHSGDKHTLQAGACHRNCLVHSFPPKVARQAFAKNRCAWTGEILNRQGLVQGGIAYDIGFHHNFLLF